MQSVAQETNSRNVSRNIFMCQGTQYIPIQMIFSATEADVIYYKEHEDGWLYLLRFYKTKKHLSLENKIQELDKTMQSLKHTTSTSFLSISDQGDGKVLSFSNRDRWNHPLFRSIVKNQSKDFEGGYNLQDGVKTWFKRNNNVTDNPEDFPDEQAVSDYQDETDPVHNKRISNDNSLHESDTNHVLQTTRENLHIPFDQIVQSMHTSMLEQIDRRTENMRHAMEKEHDKTVKMLESATKQVKESENVIDFLQAKNSKLHNEYVQLLETTRSISAQHQVLAQERQVLAERMNLQNPWNFSHAYPPLRLVSLPIISMHLPVAKEHVIVAHPNGQPFSTKSVNTFGFCWRGPPLNHTTMEKIDIGFAVGVSTVDKHYAVLNFKSAHVPNYLYDILTKLFNRRFEIIRIGSHHITIYCSHNDSLLLCPIYMAIRGFDGDTAPKVYWSFTNGSMV
jgi:hypothetical protein